MKVEVSRTDIRKNTPISNFMKIRPVGEELFHADGRTDKTELMVACRNSANAPENLSVLASNWNSHPSVTEGLITMKNFV